MQRSSSNHLDYFAPIYNAGEALSPDLTVGTTTRQQFVPPSEEEISSNKLKPRSERITYAVSLAVTYDGEDCSTAYQVPQT